ncbi:AvrRpt-cleavage domain-containing protein [Cephalotus follicularis]|uniref:AvrRpt-cleavage domain-containing protein n=1 Tax=Cephalotus follicularis TaxID=3775 RepID=A0A1Q3B004_CEPFO|nr:AvrRpt-cleavage domain-containing protein [Cephalotus follicularis]
MNPNDHPEENPEAFMNWGGGLEVDNDDHPVQPDDLLVGVEKQHSEGHTRHNALKGDNIDQRSGSHKRGTSASGIDKRNSDYSPMTPGHRRTKSDRKKSLVEGSGFSSGHSRQKSGSCASHDNHHRTASVPKFGAWDENDPSSGEGFTVIFNKVKEEKQSTSAKFPSVPKQPSNNYSHNRRKPGSPSSISKICCFQCSRGSE